MVCRTAKGVFRFSVVSVFQREGLGDSAALADWRLDWWFAARLSRQLFRRGGGCLLRPLLALFSYDILSTTCAMTKCLRGNTLGINPNFAIGVVARLIGRAGDRIKQDKLLQQAARAYDQDIQRFNGHTPEPKK